MPENVYTPYSRKDDQYLWSRKDDDLSAVAEELGRGLKSVTSRLERLRNPKTEGHKRLFGIDEDDDLDAGVAAKRPGLRPVKDCIQRIIYDPLLQASDFSVGYKDRFQTAEKESAFDAPNQSIEGPERLFLLALPEHRISYIKFRKRLVWHKEQKLDDVFGSRGGQRIQDIVASYDEWDSARTKRLRSARARAKRALGGDDDKLGSFKAGLARVHAGVDDVESLVALALSSEYFGCDGNGEDEEEEEAVPAVIALVQTLPDENAELRDELVSRLAEALG